MNDCIDRDEIWNDLYNQYEEDIKQSIANRYHEELVAPSGDVIDFEGIIDEAIEEFISDYDLEEKISEVIGNYASYDCSDCEELICEYGLESAVNDYMSDECVSVGDFDIHDCARYVIEHTDDDYEMEDLVADIENAIIEEYGEGPIHAVKEIYEAYGNPIPDDIPEDLKTIYESLVELREDSEGSILTDITLANLDEIVVSEKIAEEFYCNFACSRCPFKIDDCNRETKDTLAYAIYSRLYGTFTFKEYIIVRELIKYYFGVERLSFENMADRFSDTYGIEVDLNVMQHTIAKI